MSVWHRFVHPVTGYFRRRRGQFILAALPDIERSRICDIGGSRHFWQKLNINVPAKNITIFNISTDEVDSTDPATKDIDIIIYDGHRIPAEDKSYDIAISNSTLEHVPISERPALVKEMHRIARVVFMQTPAYEFFIEPHFIMPFVHWLPRQLGFMIIKFSPWRLLSRPSQDVIHSYFWNTALLSRQDVEALFPNGQVLEERFFGFLKSYYVLSR